MLAQPWVPDIFASCARYNPAPTLIEHLIARMI